MGTDGLHDVAPVVENKLQVKGLLDLTGIAGARPRQPGLVQSPHEIFVAVSDATDEIRTLRPHAVLAHSKHGITLELLLAAEMRRLSRSVHRIIWLNPLAGHEGFTPEARGMAAALPYVDELVAGGTARNLEELINLLQESQSAQGAAIAS
jgi:hypothetical protein